MSVTAASNALSAASVASTVASSKTMANNFEQFLNLLTTQLKNQNPLDPLDTNQFTQQLVQFAQVEQQINMNTQLGTLISLQQTAQTTQAIGLVGATVTVGGDTANLKSGTANWSFSTPKAAQATITVRDAVNGQTAYSGTFTMQAGQQNFTWDGKGNDLKPWPDGKYKITITAKDASGNNVAVKTEATGVVDGVDLSQTPPVLSVDGQIFTLDQIKQVRRGG
jgi:flagellar basal-body rod modification protein FlgD